jgi:colicin import membrane protein
MTTTPVSGASRPAVSGPVALFAGLALGALTLVAPALAQQPSMEERLRTQLRATTAQLQQTQNELALLKGATAARSTTPAPTAAATTAEVVTLRRELAEQRAALAREREAREQREQQDQQLTEARDAAKGAAERSTAQAVQVRAAYDELLKLARTSEAERQRLTLTAQAQDQAMKQCQMKNQQLYEAGLDVLKAYETLGPGTILATRLPFAAKSRVRLDEIAQQHGDKLYEGRFDPRATQEAPAAAAPAATTP